MCGIEVIVKVAAYILGSSRTGEVGSLILVQSIDLVVPCKPS